MTRYEVTIEVVTPDYKYTNRLRDDLGLVKTFPSHEAARGGIEWEIARWPNWTEGRQAAFRSRCAIIEAFQR